MATAIQIAVAAALISAWIWVLGRPLVGGMLALFGRGDQAGGQAPHPDHGITGGPSRWGIRRWLGRPAVVRRRQLMLATLLACFASFLLAIALRGRGAFLALFGLMLFVLVVHLAFAAHQGGKMVEARRRTQVEAARRQVTASGTMTIRAQRVLAEGDRSHTRILTGGILAGDRAAPLPSGAESHPWRATPILNDDLPPIVVAGDELEVSSLVEELIEKEWGSARSPGVGTPAPASAPAAPAPAAPASARVEVPVPAEVSAVDVISDDAPAQAAPAPAAATTGAQATGGTATHGAPAPGTPADSTAPAGTVDESEPIFTRAASQAAPRPRRKARPIYIHSQLDEEGFVPPRAVNHP